SQKTLEQVEKTSTNTFDSTQVIESAVESDFPSKVSPLLATSVDKPFDKDGWQYEIKWDGYRAIAFCNHDEVDLKSRNDKSFSDRSHPVIKALQQWNIHAVIDGELVVLDDDSKPDFGALQNWNSEADGDIYYYVFDVLWLDGKDLKQLQLSDRRSILEELVADSDIIRLSDNYEVSGIEFFETVKEIGLEGIMANRSDSTYSEGNRSKKWL